ncbi:MAG: hypothetical protein OEM29_08705 [Thermoplasmata archaeon]|nr:hypothetical protein [Thermoplasmata archaeon]
MTSNAHPVVLQTEGFTIFWDGISYVVRKPGDGGGKELSYCSTLEVALEMVFRHMVVLRIKAAKGYGASMEELKQIILEVRQHFANLVVMPEDVRRVAQKIGARTKTDPPTYEQSGEAAVRASLRRRPGDKEP